MLLHKDKPFDNEKKWPFKNDVGDEPRDGNEVIFSA